MSFRFSTWGRTDDGEGGSVGGGHRRGGNVIGEGGDSGGGQASREGIWAKEKDTKGKQRKKEENRKTCGPTGEGTKARAKEGSIVSARISSYLIGLHLHPFGAVHGRSCV